MNELFPGKGRSDYLGGGGEGTKLRMFLGLKTSARIFCWA